MQKCNKKNKVHVSVVEERSLVGGFNSLQPHWTDEAQVSVSVTLIIRRKKKKPLLTNVMWN